MSKKIVQYDYLRLRLPKASKQHHRKKLLQPAYQYSKWLRQATSGETINSRQED